MWTNVDRLGSVRKIRGKKRRGDSKVKGKSGEKNVVVDSIKGSREIKKDKTGYPLTFHFKKKVIMNA